MLARQPPTSGQISWKMSSSLTGQVSNAGTALNKRLTAFRQRFSTVFGRHQGYDELSTLEQPLVHDGQPNEIYDRPNSYFQQHGVHQPGHQAVSSTVRASNLSSAAASPSIPDPVSVFEQRQVPLKPCCKPNFKQSGLPQLLQPNVLQAK